MFTGIVSGRCTVLGLQHAAHSDSAVLDLDIPGHAQDFELGGSIAINGVCLTATAIDGPRISVDVMGETLRRTTIGALEPGASVNLERCTKAGARLDGHVVQGHVDAVGRVLSREDHGQWVSFRVAVPTQYAPLTAQKGSIALDGISLTLTAVSPAGAETHWVEVGIIPTTLRETTMGTRQVGDEVNIEVDVLAKYVARLNEFQEVTR